MQCWDRNQHLFKYIYFRIMFFCTVIGKISFNIQDLHLRSVIRQEKKPILILENASKSYFPHILEIVKYGLSSLIIYFKTDFMWKRLGYIQKNNWKVLNCFNIGLTFLFLYEEELEDGIFLCNISKLMFSLSLSILIQNIKFISSFKSKTF